MTGKYLYHIGCQKCGSSDALAVYEQEDGKLNGYCFSCNSFYNTLEDREIDHKHTTVSEPLRFPVRGLLSRGIEEYTCKKYGVRTAYRPSDGQEVSYYFPRTKKGVLTGWQVRLLPKDFFQIGDVKECDLFGQSVCGSGGEVLIITEGNEDCLAAYQMLSKGGKQWKVCSLPSGANIKAIKDNLEWIEKFNKVILCFDQDVPGKRAAKEAAECLSPGKAYIAKLSEKDANDMLIQGKFLEFHKAINEAKQYKPTGIVSISDIYDAAIKPIEYGKPWPWPSLTKITYGRRRKEMYGFGGGTGAGKTEGFKEIIHSVIEKDNLPVGLFFLEEHPSMTAKVIAGKLMNKRFHIPDAGWTQEELQEGIKRLENKVFLYDHFGQKSWEEIRTKIRYMVVTLGIKDIFLDHLTALVADIENVNKAFERIMADMAALTQELDFTLYYISHLSTPMTGPSHEEGGRVTLSQFRGSRSIGFWSHYVFGYERNQQAEDVDERNTVTLRVLKDRYTGLSTGETIKLKYYRDIGRFLEKDYEF